MDPSDAQAFLAKLQDLLEQGRVIYSGRVASYTAVCLRAHSRTWSAYHTDNIRTSVVTAVAVWEILVTSRKEYLYIWRRPCNWITLAYIVARYWCLVYLCGSLYSWFWVNLISSASHHRAIESDDWCSSQPGRTAEECEHFYLFQPIAGLVVFVGVQAIFIARVWALWDRNRIILFALW